MGERLLGRNVNLQATIEEAQQNVVGEVVWKEEISAVLHLGWLSGAKNYCMVSSGTKLVNHGSWGFEFLFELLMVGMMGEGGGGEDDDMKRRRFSF